MKFKLLILLLLLAGTIFAQDVTVYKRSSSSQPVDKLAGLGVGQLVMITDTVPYLYKLTHSLAYGQTMRYAFAHSYAISEALVSGTTIKTINGATVLGGGNLVVTATVDTTTAGTGVVNKTRMSHLSSYPTLNQNTTGTANNISLAGTNSYSLRYISGAWRAWPDSVGSGAVVDTTTSGTGLVNKTRMSHLTSYPTLNQTTTGTSAGLTAAYIDWNAVSGGAFIQNKPSTFTPSAHNQAISTITGLQDSLTNRYRRADTANVVLSRTRAGHDYQVKGSYVTGTPWTGLYWAYADTTATLETKTYNTSKLALKVPTSRTISTTSPLSGGGDLSGNRTLIINTDTLTSWARRKDTATILLSRTRAGHDYQPKGSYLTALSVGLSLPGEITVTNSPVTSSGTLTGVWHTQNINLVFASPTTGDFGTPSFRSLVAADIPALSYATSVGLALPSQFTVSNSPVTSSGNLTAIWHDTIPGVVFAGPATGGNTKPKFRALVATDVPTLNQSTSGSAGSVANSLSNGYGLNTFTYNGSGAVSPVVDTTHIVSTVRFGHLSAFPTLNQSTTGQSGSVANSLTNGYGINSLTYNGSSALSIVADSTHLISTVRFGHISAYPTLNQSTTGNATTATTATQVGHTLGNGYGISSLSFTGAATGTVLADSSVLVSTVRLGHLSAYPSGILKISDTTSTLETKALATSQLATKQATLVSATNIKTVNSTSLLGSGDLTVTASVDTTTAGTGIVNKTRMSHLSAYPTLNQSTSGTSANVTGIVALANGGTNANLTASTGGILYSGASAFAVLSGVATDNKVLMSANGAAPKWSTPTYPNTSGSQGQILESDGTNYILSTETHAAPGASGNIMKSDGTNWTSVSNMITLGAGVIDSLRQVTTGFNKVWCGAVDYASTIDSLIFIGYGAEISLTVMVGYGSSATATPTYVVTAGTAVTSITSATRIGTSGFNNSTPGAGCIISIWTSSVTTKGAAVSVIIKGHRN